MIHTHAEQVINYCFVYPDLYPFRKQKIWQFWNWQMRNISRIHYSH